MYVPPTPPTLNYNNPNQTTAGDQYLTGLTLYFIGYVLFEVPCNIVLKKTTPRIWLPTLTLVWGVVATLLGVVQNYAGYLTSRTGTHIPPSPLNLPYHNMYNAEYVIKQPSA